MKKHCAICLLHLAALFFHASAGSAETVRIGADDPFWIAERGILSPSPNALAVAVNGETPFSLDMNGVAALTFDYQADGWFSLTWDSIADRPRNVIDAFVQTVQLQKGGGAVTLDFTRNRQWGENTIPYLKVRGTGTLVMRNISAQTVEKPEEYLRRKRASFFMMPENIKPYSANFLTPIYADEHRNLYFADVLGILLIAAAIAVTAISWKWKAVPARRIVINLSLLCMALYGVHFVVRFAPEIHATPFMPREEKISRNMYDREMGELIENARQKIPPHAAVFLDSGENVYPKRIICFYLMPRSCEYDTDLNPEAEAVVGYYPRSLLPRGFKKVFAMNENVYIALRQ